MASRSKAPCPCVAKHLLVCQCSRAEALQQTVELGRGDLSGMMLEEAHDFTSGETHRG